MKSVINANHKLSNSCVNKIPTPCPAWLSPAVVGTQGQWWWQKGVHPWSIMQGKEGARSVGTWKPLGEDTLPSSWSVTCWWENLYSREHGVQEQGWGVKEVLRGDPGDRQRQHHPWPEPGSGYVSSKPLQSDHVLHGFAFISPTWASHTWAYFSHLGFSHLYFSHLCSSHLCSSHLYSFCPLSTAHTLSPFPVHHILSGLFLKKMEDAPNVTGDAKSVFISLQPFTTRKKMVFVNTRRK